MKIKGNEKYEFYSIQLQCHSTSHSTRPNPTKPKDGLNPCPSLGRRDALTLLHNCSNKLHNKFTTNQSSGIRASRTCSVYVRPAMTHRLSVVNVVNKPHRRWVCWQYESICLAKSSVQSLGQSFRGKYRGYGNIRISFYYSKSNKVYNRWKKPCMPNTGSILQSFR